MKIQIRSKEAGKDVDVRYDITKDHIEYYVNDLIHISEDITSAFYSVKNNFLIIRTDTRIFIFSSPRYGDQTYYNGILIECNHSFHIDILISTLLLLGMPIVQYNSAEDKLERQLIYRTSSNLSVIQSEDLTDSEGVLVLNKL